jgi:hypothetical protein
MREACSLKCARCSGERGGFEPERAYLRLYLLLVRLAPRLKVRVPPRFSRTGLRFDQAPISQSLANHASDGLIDRVLIVNDKRDTIVVAEVKFREIAVQLLLGATHR